MPGFPAPYTVFSSKIGRGKTFDTGKTALGVCRLPSDPVGNFTLQLTNIVVGSVLRLEDGLGNLISHTPSVATSSVSLTIPTYTTGSPRNQIKIKVRKGTASPYYKPWQYMATSFVGSLPIYVSQESEE